MTRSRPPPLFFFLGATGLARRTVTPASVVSVQVFDHRKFNSKKKGQGFLGVATIKMGTDYNLLLGGSSACSRERARRPMLCCRGSPARWARCLGRARTLPLYAATLFLTLHQGEGSNDPVSGTVTVTLGTPSAGAAAAVGAAGCVFCWEPRAPLGRRGRADGRSLRCGVVR